MKNTLQKEPYKQMMSMICFTIVSILFLACNQTEEVPKLSKAITEQQLIPKGTSKIIFTLKENQYQGYQFADEIGSTNSNARGTISMANSGPNTNGSQFFINTVDNSFLNPKHTAFGTVTKGMDIVDMISKSETDTRDRPVKDVIIEKVIVE